MATPRTGRPVGRPPKPTAVKRAEGNPGKRALPPVHISDTDDDEVIDVPEVPDNLGTEGEAAWNRLWGAAYWLDRDVDYLLVSQLCETIDQISVHKNLIAIGEVPEFVVMSNGALQEHAYVKQIRSNTATMLTLMSELGFTPTARARLGIGESNDGDPTAAFFQRSEARQIGSSIQQSSLSPDEDVETFDDEDGE